MPNPRSSQKDRCGALPARQTLPAVELGSRALRYLHPLADRGGLRRPTEEPTAPKDAPPHSPFRRSARLRRLESVLFLSREPISARKLSQIADLADAHEARTLVRRLNALYDQSGRAFRVEEAAGGYLLQTRARFANWIRRCPNTPREMRLSAPTLETLTVIAYRQPVARSEIEAIRGVNCGEILRQLLDRDLVRIAGRSDELGRPYLYETTPRFLQAFGLNRVEDLPAIRRTEEAAPGAASEGEPLEEQPSHEEIQSREGDAEVSVTTKLKPTTSEESTESRGVAFVNPFSPRLAAAKRDEDEDEDEEEDEDWDDDEEDDDDLDEEEDDLDDEEEDDLEEDEWEEVDDEDDEEDLDEEEEDDEEWEEEDEEEWEEEEGDDDDDDDDWDEDEEEEEEDDD